MSARSEGQCNSVVYEDSDLYRGQERRDAVLVNIEDMNRNQIRENQKVTVKSTVGQIESVLARSYDIRSGNALMYYPADNVLDSRKVEPESRTPSLKSMIVKTVPQINIPA